MTEESARQTRVVVRRLHCLEKPTTAALRPYADAPLRALGWYGGLCELVPRRHLACRACSCSQVEYQRLLPLSRRPRPASLLPLLRPLPLSPHSSPKRW